MSMGGRGGGAAFAGRGGGGGGSPAAAVAAFAVAAAVGGRGGGGGGRRSDIALKHDVVLLGHLDNGLGYYRFSYLGSEKAYVGVMAQEVQARDAGRGDARQRRLSARPLRQARPEIPHLPRLARRGRADSRRDRGFDDDQIIIRFASLAPAPRPRLFAGMLCLAAPDARAQQTFKTPDEAASALAAAVKSGARRDMLRVLGSDGEDIISSGDEVADAESRERFTAAYDAKHSVKLEGDKKAVIDSRQ